MRTNMVQSKVRKGIRNFNSEKKRILSSATIIIFSLFTISCTYTKMVKVVPGKDYENREIIGFVKINGEKVDLPKGIPGTIKKNAIQWKGKTEQQYEIKREEIKSVMTRPDKKGVVRVLTIVTKDGKIYYPETSVQKSDSISFSAHEPILTPLSDIKMIKIVKTSVAAIFAGILISIVISTLLLSYNHTLPGRFM
jgi:hypothetical protein